MSEIRIRHWAKFGAAIRDARLAQTLSQAELAQRAGVSRSWLAKVEAGHRGAEFEQILLVLSALGLTLSISDAPSAPAADQRNSHRPAPRAPKAIKSKPVKTKPVKTTGRKGAASRASSTTTKSGDTGTPPSRRTAEPQVPAAAMTRLIDQHRAALETRRTAWGTTAGRGSKVDRA